MLGDLSLVRPVVYGTPAFFKHSVAHICILLKDADEGERMWTLL